MKDEKQQLNTQEHASNDQARLDAKTGLAISRLPTLTQFGYTPEQLKELESHSNPKSSGYTIIEF